MDNSQKTKKRIEYQVVITQAARKQILKLDLRVADKICERLVWLGKNADFIVHHQLTSLPDDLKGLCRLRSGDWRILYWVYHNLKRIVVYGVAHRSEVYKRLIK